MLRERNILLKRISMGLDATIIAGSYISAHYLRQNIHWFYTLNLFPSREVLGSLYPLDRYLWLLWLIIPLWLFFLYYYGAYRSRRLERFSHIISRYLMASCWSMFSLFVLSYLSKITFLSRSFLLVFFLLSLSLFIVKEGLAILVLRRMRRKGRNIRYLLIVGTGKRAQAFAASVLQKKAWGLCVVGFIDEDRDLLGKEIMGIKVLGQLKDIPRLLQDMIIDEVVFIVPRSWLPHLEEAILACEELGITVRIASDFFNTLIARSYYTELDGIPLLTHSTIPHREGALLLKRLLDMVVSGTAIISLAPLFLLIGLAIKLTSSGPVIFKQKRSGLNGRLFTLYKFRTMIAGAEGVQEALKAQNEMSGPVFKMKKDPRVTRIGAFLRKTSLDELPQLFNVFKGDMSLVGPRPPIPAEVKQYGRWQRRRLSVKPGITCLWQISGRNNIDFEEWMRLDMQYIDNWSLGQDIKILLKTVPAVLLTRGAR